MRRLLIIFLLPILPIVGKFTLVIKTYINNEETKKPSPLLVSLGDNVNLYCYLNVTFGNTSFVKNNVEWSTPIFSNNNEKKSGTIRITKFKRDDEGDYKCLSNRHYLSQKIQLKLNIMSIPFPDDLYYKRLPKLYENDFKKYEEFRFPEFNLSDIKIPEIHYVSSYSDKGPILFFPGIIVIILGLTRMCYYMRNRNRVPWQRLRIANCTHHLCIHRRRTDPSATCLLQNSRTQALSVVIIRRNTEPGVENTVTEPDVPPPYNEVIPQELPPTYSEAVSNVPQTQT